MACCGEGSLRVSHETLAQPEEWDHMDLGSDIPFRAEGLPDQVLTWQNRQK